MKNYSFFWERIAVRYSKQPVADEATYQKKLQITREFLLPNMRVLEIGCGTGLLTEKSLELWEIFPFHAPVSVSFGVG